MEEITKFVKGIYIPVGHRIMLEIDPEMTQKVISAFQRRGYETYHVKNNIYDISHPRLYCNLI